MTPDQYLQGILTREAVDTGIFSPVRGVHSVLDPIIREWAGNSFLSMHPSGSFMKGTANKSGTDIDFFISLSEQTTETLKEEHRPESAFRYDSSIDAKWNKKHEPLGATLEALSYCRLLPPR
jgi:hypothetical protein